MNTDNYPIIFIATCILYHYYIESDSADGLAPVFILELVYPISGDGPETPYYIQYIIKIEISQNR